MVQGGALYRLAQGGVSAALPVLPVGAQEATASEGLCVTLCSHWSYIGIGWQLGIESSVLSVTDAMGMADRPPHVKTCINLDARAYEFMAEKFPEVAARLKEYLKAGKVELIGGTYGQPMGTTLSGESNIRQLVYGRETIRKALGYEMVTFLEEEEFSHPQIPQIALGAGYRYASLAQVDTWGNAGIPRLELNVLHWQGKDGTTIPCIPKNSLFGYSPDLKQLSALPAFKKLQELGKPLLFTWEEFGWEPHEEPAYLKAPEKYLKFSQESPIPVEFVTLKEYLDKYGAQSRETRYLDMDAWRKLLTWGLGGDQVRIFNRKVECLLLAAECFDAVSSTLGARINERQLDDAWKHLLASESHDVGLCEYSRWQGDRMAPLDRVEDHHNFTWGAMGYNHMDAAQREGQSVLDTSLGNIVKHIGSQSGMRGQLVATVFNPHAWERTDIVPTGRIYPTPQKARGVVVRDDSGRAVPSQLIKSETDRDGNLLVANVAFLAEKVPGVGYATYYLDFGPATPEPPATDLRINEERLELENKYVKIRLSTKHGAIVSLVDKRTSREMLNGEQAAFPIFLGRPNPDYPLRGGFLRWKYTKEDLANSAMWDSSKSVAAYGPAAEAPATKEVDWRVIQKSTVRWLEKGPLRATVKTQHNWPLLKFETHVTLCAGAPGVEVTSRVLAEVPPPPDALDANGRFPVEIKEGYWLSFAPGFQPASVVRDFPLGIEPTQHSVFQALTFVDLVGEDAGLLVWHAGTQYFKRDESGVWANLLMREWESYFTGEYGWPRYSEYRHALMPHGPELSNAERLRASAQFSQKLVSFVGPPQNGSLPKRKGFITLGPAGVELSALRSKGQGGFELRVLEVEGRESATTIELGFPISNAVETDLLGRKQKDVSRKGNQLSFQARKWRVHNFRLSA
jgi:alpha-mannosidase